MALDADVAWENSDREQMGSWDYTWKGHGTEGTQMKNPVFIWN